MENVIIIAVIATVIGLAGRYLYRAKKRCVKCIGCPSGCGGKCGCHCGKSDP